jgi:hypothetical protein
MLGLQVAPLTDVLRHVVKLHVGQALLECLGIARRAPAAAAGADLQFPRSLPDGEFAVN